MERERGTDFYEVSLTYVVEGNEVHTLGTDTLVLERGRERGREGGEEERGRGKEGGREREEEGGRGGRGRERGMEGERGREGERG